jgi:hypothetical protein
VSNGSRTGSIGAGVVIGLVAGGVAIGVGQLLAGLVNPQASPIIAVGQPAIDGTPEWLKSFAIRTFGEKDKLVLLGGIALVLVLVAVVLGIATVRRVMVGVVGLCALGAIGVAAALTRPASRPIDMAPSIVGSMAGVAMIALLRRTLLPMQGAPAAPPVPDGSGAGIDRRRFLLLGAAGAIGAMVAAGIGNLFARRFQADASRAAVRIPTPVSRAVSPARVDLSIPELAPFFTPSDRFYRVDTALLVPAVMAEEW